MFAREAWWRQTQTDMRRAIEGLQSTSRMKLARSLWWKRTIDWRDCRGRKARIRTRFATDISGVARSHLREGQLAARAETDEHPPSTQTSADVGFTSVFFALADATHKAERLPKRVEATSAESRPRLPSEAWSESKHLLDRIQFLPRLFTPSAPHLSASCRSAPAPSPPCLHCIGQDQQDLIRLGSLIRPSQVQPCAESTSCESGARALHGWPENRG